VRYRFYTADVFTDQIFGGNQLAVFPNADGLETVQMQQVAQEFNLSETVFVFPPQKLEHTRQLRIFTPGAELPFAGHPTVGTAHILAAIGEIQLTGQKTDIVFEEGVGPVPVSIYAVEGRPASAQLSAAVMPEFGPEPPAASELAAMLSLDEADVRYDTFAPQAVSCGLPFLFVPLQNRDELRRARIDQSKWEKLLSNYWASQVFVFTQDAELDGSDLRSRMFAPAFGITEDPATGSAVTALAGYLGVRDATQTGTLTWVVEQGFEMGRPSILNVEADKQNGDIVAIRVGGSTVLVSEGQMEIPAL
jgi:trans-2,3-dihydro-3-hydroxyanthranilate isomerase